MLSWVLYSLDLAKFRGAEGQTVGRRIQEGLAKFSTARVQGAGRRIQGGLGKFSTVQGLDVVSVTPVGFRLVDESDFNYLVAIV